MLRFFKHPRRRDAILWGLLVIYLAILGLLAARDPQLLVFYRNSLQPELSAGSVSEGSFPLSQAVSAAVPGRRRAKRSAAARMVSFLGCFMVESYLST